MGAHRPGPTMSVHALRRRAAQKKQSRKSKAAKRARRMD